MSKNVDTNNSCDGCHFVIIFNFFCLRLFVNSHFGHIPNGTYDHISTCCSFLTIKYGHIWRINKVRVSSNRWWIISIRWRYDDYIPYRNYLNKFFLKNFRINLKFTFTFIFLMSLFSLSGVLFFFFKPYVFTSWIDLFLQNLLKDCLFLKYTFDNFFKLLSVGLNTFNATNF